DYSEEIAKAIDQEIRRTIDECYEKARKVLEENRDKLELISAALLEKETLDAEEITALVEGRSLAELEASRRKKEQEAAARSKGAVRPERRGEKAAPGKAKVQPCTSFQQSEAA